MKKSFGTKVSFLECFLYFTENYSERVLSEVTYEKEYNHLESVIGKKFKNKLRYFTGGPTTYKLSFNDYAVKKEEVASWLIENVSELEPVSTLHGFSISDGQSVDDIVWLWWSPLSTQIIWEN